MFIYAVVSTKPSELSVVCKWTSLIEKEINTVNVLLVYYDQMHHSKVYGLSVHLPQAWECVEKTLSELLADNWLIAIKVAGDNKSVACVDSLCPYFFLDINTLHGLC